MSTFALNPFHSDVLRCRDCGQAVANVSDLAQADEPPQQMSAQQAVRCWPGAARQIVAHDIACAWQLAEGLGRRGERTPLGIDAFPKGGLAEALDAQR
jgi:hypothetical protein